MFNKPTFPIPQVTKLSTIRLSRLLAQTFVTGVNADIVWDVPTVSDVDSNVYSYNSVTGLVTLNISGWYQFSFLNSWVASAVGARLSAFNITDGILYVPRNDVLATNPNITSPRITEYSAKIYNVGSTVSFRVGQTSGGNLNVNGGVNNLSASIIRLSDI